MPWLIPTAGHCCCKSAQPTCRIATVRYHCCGLRRWFPFIERVFADTAYAADRVANATRIIVDIVRKLPDQVGFAVLPRRWVVERFFAWINRNRRLAKDFEGTLASATAFLYAASVMLLTRRLARSQ
jgi:transposase